MTVDLDAIVANWRALDALSDPTTETAAVIKADAYGLGMPPVSRALAAAGVRTFFVAYAEEGAALRDAVGPAPRIAVLSGLMQGDAEYCKQYQLIPCLNTGTQIGAHHRHLRGHPCFLQINSGMHRLGLDPVDLERFRPLFPTLNAGLVLSHLACADDPDHPQNREQLARFEAQTRDLGCPRSLSATGGILLGPDFHFDLTRPGIGLFGGQPFSGGRRVVTLDLPVLQVRDVPPGEHVGYGGVWRAQRRSRIATLAAGYADGLPRALTGAHLQLYAGNTPCPMVGRVSMDVITVDVTDLDREPDYLQILNAEQGIDDLGKAAGTIGYEILTGLGPRLESIYKGGAS